MFYNSVNQNKKKISGINTTALLSWITVLGIILLFWSGMAVAYQKDYVPHAIAKVEHKERKFLANHKAIQKRLTGIRSLV